MTKIQDVFSTKKKTSPDSQAVHLEATVGCKSHLIIKIN